MSYGTDVLAEDIRRIAEVADVALQAAYPGIQIQPPTGLGGLWSVALPGKHGAVRHGTHQELSKAIALVTFDN